MAKTDLIERLTALLEPAAADNGFELVAVEQAGGKGTPIIRVLLDREGGIDLDAIAEANAWITRDPRRAGPDQRALHARGLLARQSTGRS